MAEKYDPGPLNPSEEEGPSSVDGEIGDHEDVCKTELDESNHELEPVTSKEVNPTDFFMETDNTLAEDIDIFLPSGSPATSEIMSDVVPDATMERLMDRVESESVRSLEGSDIEVEVVAGVEEQAAQLEESSFDIGQRMNGMEDEDDDILLEPRFRYDRIKEDEVNEMFSKEIASCMIAHDRFVVVGTHHGYVFVMDHQGHVDHKNVPVYRPHRCAVTRIAIDGPCRYIMTCSSDSRVVIHGVGCREYNQVVNLQYVPRSIAMSKDYARANSPQHFVIGERNLVLYEKRFFKFRETIIFQGTEKDGFITKITWKGPYIAFTNEQGTRIYDRSFDRMITLIAPSHDVDRLRSTRFPPTHCWLDNESLVIGWADTVVVVNIVKKDLHGLPTKYAEIRFSWKLDMSVSGVSFVVGNDHKWSEIAVFGLKPADEESESGVDAFCDIASVMSLNTSTMAGPPPHVQLEILEPESSTSYLLQAEDKIAFKTLPHSLPGQFHMSGLPYDNMYFFLGPHELACATPYSADDKVRWRLDNDLIEEAWEYASENADKLEAKETNPFVIGRMMIAKLMADRKFRVAAKKLKQVCGENKSEWEYFVNEFELARSVTSLADVLPQERPQLEPECYEYVLHATLYNDLKTFRRLIQNWNPDLYRVGALIALTLQRMDNSTPSNNETSSSLGADQEVTLSHALANLFIYDRKYDSAIKLYLSFKDKQIFNIIRRYQLFEYVKDQISELMTIDVDLALGVLLENEQTVPPAEVMAKLSKYSHLQLSYLKRLFDRNAGAEFSDMAVKLFAERERDQLLPFLRKSESYHINRALEICNKQNFVEERIFLLAKSGNQKAALDLIINKYKEKSDKERLEMAVDFCKEHEDDDLWTLLINEVIKSEKHISQLLNRAGSCIDPLRLIRRIPEEMEIPGLRDSIVKILRDYEVQVQLQKGCHQVTLDDVTYLFNGYMRTAHGATFINKRVRCVLCTFPLYSNAEELKVFGCTHAVHSRCCHELERRVMERSAIVMSELGELVLCPVCSDDTDDIVVESA